MKQNTQKRKTKAKDKQNAWNEVEYFLIPSPFTLTRPGN